MPVGPEKAYSYITRNFREITPHVIGALRLLARCYSVEELNDRGYGFYVSFRPEVQGWGDKGTLYVSNIIDMIPPEADADYPELGDQVSETTIPAIKSEVPALDSIDNDAHKQVVGNDADTSASKCGDRKWTGRNSAPNLCVIARSEGDTAHKS